MTSALPSFRLTGATVLRDGVLQDRTVAVSGGRISAGPYPAVDMSGYFVLPGVIDLSLPGAGATPSDSVTGIAAAAGVTTGWITLDWQDDPQPTETRLAALARHTGAGGPDIRPCLRYDVRLDAAGDRLLSAVRRYGIDRVIFWDPAADPLATSRAAPRSADIPRRLCRLAEAFDILGVVYGSQGDPDGETREFYAMLGARICEAPISSQAATLARAVGDPVVARIGPQDDTRPGGLVRTLLRAGKCDALMSGDGAQTLAGAVLGLVAEGALPLERAWPLISAAPAQIQRLPERGTLDKGRRADLAIVSRDTGRVEATIAQGRLVHATGEARERFAATDGALALAAE